MATFMALMARHCPGPSLAEMLLPSPCVAGGSVPLSPTMVRVVLDPLKWRGA